MTSLLGKTPLQRITLLLTLAEAAIVITVEAILFHYFASASALDNGPSKGVPIYLMIFILAEVMQCVLVWDAIRSQNTIQILGVVFFHACCFLYSCLQLSQIHMAYSNISSSEDNGNYPPYRRLQASLIIVIVVTGIAELAFLWLSWKLFQEFGWRIYKKIGADVRKKRMYRAYHILLMLLKLDVFFFIGFAVQFIMLVLKFDDAEFSLTIVALPVIILILLAAVYAVRREQVHMMFAFMIGLLCAISYFLFKTIRIWTDPQRKKKYDNVKYYLTVFSFISLLMSLVTLVQAILCYLNFGKGLKPYLLREGAGLERPDGREGRIMVLETEDEAAQVTRMGQVSALGGPPHPMSLPGIDDKDSPPLGPTGLTRGGSVYMANPAFLSSPVDPRHDDDVGSETESVDKDWYLMDSKLNHAPELKDGRVHVEDDDGGIGRYDRMGHGRDSYGHSHDAYDRSHHSYNHSHASQSHASHGHSHDSYGYSHDSYDLNQDPYHPTRQYDHAPSDSARRREDQGDPQNSTPPHPHSSSRRW